MIGRLQIALVTGASSGIGRAVAVRLRKAGMRVLAVGRDLSALKALETECGAEPIAGDVRDLGQLAPLFTDVAIDVLVNNAGVLPMRSAFQEIDPAAIDAMIDTNLKAPLHLARLAVPGMIERRRGHLFFVTSSAGRWPHAAAAVYGATKAGLSLFSDALRADLLGTGVRVTDIAPGRVETQLYRTAISPEAVNTELYEGYAPIRPEDIAELIMTALAMPENVNVSRMEVFPTSQAIVGARIVKHTLTA